MLPLRCRPHLRVGSRRRSHGWFEWKNGGCRCLGCDCGVGIGVRVESVWGGDCRSHYRPWLSLGCRRHRAKGLETLASKGETLVEGLVKQGRMGPFA
ncbi:hypothetical protein V6N11_071758 [Hibiscus sabdariffa]|uniref:Uncharacterized protein n=1 Tax=Hibiscus sabdariffa TaxID=183260 RepID=A0ABR2U0Z9_9ROSI